jgi:tetratricopeptide (TPR) repeat protein
MTFDSCTPSARIPSRRPVWRRVFLGVGLLLVVVAAVVAWPWWRASGLLQSARQALIRGDLAAAVSDLEAAARLQPQRAEVHYLLAVADRRTGRLADFERRLRAARRQGWSDQDLELQRWLAAAQAGDLQTVERPLQAMIEGGAADDVAQDIYEALAKGYLASYRLRDAWRCLDYWLQWRPDAPQARLLRADIFERRDKLEEAIADYRAVLQVLPEDAETHLKLAQILLKRDQAADAKSHFERALAAHPDNLDALLGLAGCEARAGAADQAGPRLEQVLAQECAPQQRAAARAEQGRLLLTAGKADEAVEALTEAAVLAPADNTVHYSLARALVAAGKPELAQFHHDRVRRIREQYERLAALTSQVVDRPQDPALRFEAGLILIEQGFVQDGLGWLRTALLCDPQHRPTREYLDGRSHFQTGLQAYASRDATAVRRAAEALAALPALRPHGQLLQGMALLLSGQLREAIERFGEAREHPETRIPAYTLSGEVLYKTQQFRDAERILTVALQLAPDSTDVRRWLAAIYHDIGAMDDAIQQLEIVARQDPSDPRPHRLMGLIHKDFEAYAQAADEYRESLRRDPAQPDRAQILLELSETLLKQQKHAEAIQTLGQAPVTAQTLALQAQCLHAQGDPDTARQRILEALERDPDNLDALQLAATLDLAADLPEAAVQRLEHAVQQHPKQWRVRYQLSQAYQRLGREPQAQTQLQAMKDLRKTWERFTELHRRAITEPGDVETRYQLGLIARELDEIDLARTWLTAALGMNPEHAGARKALQALDAGAVTR